MLLRRVLPVLILALLAVPASASAGISETATAEESAAQANASAATARIAPGRIIRTRRSWTCRGPLRNYGRLPIKVISNIRNPGDSDAIRLIGCIGDGNARTVDLILDVNGNRRDLGTAYDAVRIGQNSRGLVVTGDVECGAQAHEPEHPPGHRPGALGPEHHLPELHLGPARLRRVDVLGRGRRLVRRRGRTRGIPTNLICDRCTAGDLQPEPAHRPVAPLRRAELRSSASAARTASSSRAELGGR